MLQQEYNILKDSYWSKLIRSKADLPLDPYTAFSFAFDNAYDMCKQMWASDEDNPTKIINKSQYSENCDNHIVQDHELVDYFAKASNMLRLQAAAHVASGIITGDGDYFYYYLPGSKQRLPNSISRKCPEEVARVAFIFADALIAESQKGGAE